MAAEPDAELMIHPECGCTTQMLWLLGEGELQPPIARRCCRRAAWSREAETARSPRFLVATETGILHQLRKGEPAGKAFEPSTKAGSAST